MKWFRLLLAMFLLVGMLLGATVAYADDGDEDDGGLNVDITVVGDNADVGVDLHGDDNTANVNFHSENPTVWINGQNINEPTVIYQGGGVSGSWVKKRISQVVDPLYSWAEESWARLNLTADGLAKVILLAQNNESEVEASFSQLGGHSERLTTLESDSAYLGERVDALEAQDAAITARVNYLTAYYNRILAILIGAFSLVVIGLIIGLVVVARRTRISA